MTTLINKALKVDWESNLEIINFHKQNQLLFSNYQAFQNSENLIDFIQISARIATSYISKNNYNKAITLLKNNNILISKAIQQIPEETVQNSNYLLGVALGYKGKSKDALTIFKKLIEQDSENHQYQKWYVQLKADLLFEKLKFITFIGFAIVLGDLISTLGFSYKFNDKITLMGYILIVIGATIPYGRAYLQKKKL